MIGPAIIHRDDRITIGPLEIRHAKLLAAWMNDPATTRFLFSGRQPLPTEWWAEEIARLQHVGRNALFIFGDPAGEPIGFGGLYDMHPIDHKAEFRLFIGEEQSRGKGIGTHLSRWLINYGFGRLNLHRIWLGVNAEHVFAIVAYQQAGFETEAVLRDDCARDGRFYDTIRMAILRDAWLNWNPARRAVMCGCGCRQFVQRPVLYRRGHRSKGGLSLAQRFWSRVEKGGECWLWRGTIRPNGYGWFHPSGASVAAHRLAYTLVFGEIGPKLFVCHRCDVPACVRPDHLFLGTAADNARDRDAKGRGAMQRSGTRQRIQVAARHAVPKGEQQHHAQLTADKVRTIRASKRSGRALAREYGVHETTISAVRHRRNWRHI